MHILLGAIIGCVVSVALTYAASKVIKRPLTWKDVAASAMAGIIGGAVATATLGVGAATTARTVVSFAAGGATGSASGQVTDNVLHGEPIGRDVAKSTAFGTVIGAGTLGAGKALAPLGRHAGKLLHVGNGARSAGTATAGGHGGNPLAGAAAGLDDAIVPVYRYVKKALGRDVDEGDDAHSEPVLANEGGALGALEALNAGAESTQAPSSEQAASVEGPASPFAQLRGQRARAVKPPSDSNRPLGE